MDFNRKICDEVASSQRIQDLEKLLKDQGDELMAAKAAVMEQGVPMGELLVRIRHPWEWPENLQNYVIKRKVLVSLNEVGVFRVKNEPYCFIRASVQCRLH
jgi:hypothetical protein